ncbi:MAG: YIP1 family protein [Fidelibacterota bacterium]
MSEFTDRIVRSARLDISLYEEVEGDPNTMGQAMTVVVLSGLAAGIGSFDTGGFSAMVAGTIVALVGWFVWAYLTYFIGTRILPEPQTRADYGQLLRTIGFASSPGLIRVLGILTFLRPLVFPVAAIWMLVAMVIAVRQALDYTSTWRAVGVCVIGWFIQLLILALFMSVIGPPPQPSP